MAGKIDRMEEDKSFLIISTGKPTYEILLGRFRLRFEDDIRMYVKELHVNTMNLIDLAR
jgi:hypothetical protein